VPSVFRCVHCGRGDECAPQEAKLLEMDHERTICDATEAREATEVLKHRISKAEQQASDRLDEMQKLLQKCQDAEDLAQAEMQTRLRTEIDLKDATQETKACNRLLQRESEHRGVANDSVKQVHSLSRENAKLQAEMKALKQALEASDEAATKNAEQMKLGHMEHSLLQDACRALEAENEKMKSKDSQLSKMDQMARSVQAIDAALRDVSQLTARFLSDELPDISLAYPTDRTVIQQLCKNIQSVLSGAMHQGDQALSICLGDVQKLHVGHTLRPRSSKRRNSRQ